MGFYGNNVYRNNIRRKYKIYGLVRFLYILFLFAVIAGVIYYFLTKTDAVDKVQEASKMSLEEITGYSYEDIGKVIKKSDKTLVGVDEFINKYSSNMYKLNGFDSLQIKQELEIYYVYNKEDTFIYEVRDLENGSIRVQKMTGSVKVYDLTN